MILSASVHEELLRLAKAAQRLQSCRRLRDRWMARDADRGNRSSGFASLRCDYERGSLACYPRFSDRAHHRMGLRADAGRIEANGVCGSIDYKIGALSC